MVLGMGAIQEELVQEFPVSHSVGSCLYGSTKVSLRQRCSFHPCPITGAPATLWGKPASEYGALAFRHDEEVIRRADLIVKR
jgi:hypothetical protein